MKLDDSSFLLSNHAFKIAALLWGFGFLCALMPLAAYEAQSILLAVLSINFAALFALSGGENISLRRAVKSPLLVVVFAFWALTLLSVIFSEARSVSFIYFMVFSLFPLSFLLYIRALHYYWVQMAYALAGLLAALAAFALVQYLFLPEWLYRGAPQWPFANPNMLAAMLSFGALGGLGWMLGAPDRRQSNIALVLTALCLVAVLATGARGAIFAIMIAALFMVVMARVFAAKHVRCLSVLAMIGIVAAIAFIVAYKPDIVTGSVDAWNAVFQPGAPLLSSRAAIWDSAFAIFKDYFWTGTGMGTFFLYYPAYRGGDFSTAGLMAHNEPLQLAVEMGALAPVLFYGFVVLAALRMHKALKAIAPEDPRRLLILAPFCVLGAVIMHAHISYHFHVPSLLVVMGVVLGFWYKQTAACLPPENAETASPGPRWGAAVVLMAMLALFAPLQVSDILISRAGNALDAGRMDRFIADVNRAGKISAGQNARAMIAAVNVPIGILQLNTPFMEKDEARGMFDKTMGLLDRAEAMNPRLPQTQYHRAELLSYTQPFLDINSEKTVEDYLKEALKIDPLHLPSRVMLANLYIRKGRQEEALALLKDGAKWSYYRQNPAFYYDKLAGLAEDLGDQETAEWAANKLLAYRPKPEDENPPPQEK